MRKTPKLLYSIACLAPLFFCSLAVGQDSPSKFESLLNANTPASDSAAFQSQDPNTISLEAVVKLIGDIEVPALETGPLSSINAREGQMVEAEFVLAKIRNDKAQRALEEAQLNYQLADDKANDNSSISAASSKARLHRIEFEKTSRLLPSGSRSESEYETAKAQVEVANAELRRAENEVKQLAIEAKIELVKINAIQDLVDRHMLKSPITGNVVEIKHQEGEWVNAGDPVFRVIQMDKLRVVGTINGLKYNPSEIMGRDVVVTANVAGQPGPIDFSGKIVFTNLEQGGQEDMYDVWAEVDNKQDGQGYWQLMPGSKVNMKIITR